MCFCGTREQKIRRDALYSLNKVRSPPKHATAIPEELLLMTSVLFTKQHLDSGRVTAFRLSLNPLAGDSVFEEFHFYPVELYDI